MKKHYASAREIAIVLDHVSDRPELRKAWWSVSEKNHASPTLIQDSLALYGFTSHIMEGAYLLDLSSTLSPETRWELNFPSYQLVIDGLCEQLEGSGWMCPSPAGSSDCES